MCWIATQPYEAPDNPELSLKTVNRTIGETVLEVIELLEKNGIIPRAANDKVGKLFPRMNLHFLQELCMNLSPTDQWALRARVRAGGEKEGGRDAQIGRDLEALAPVAAGPCRGMGFPAEWWDFTEPNTLTFNLMIY